MYNTAKSMEDLDVTVELYSFDTVLNVSEHHQIWDEEYQDADFLIFVLDLSQLDKIKSLLEPFGYVSYIDDDDSGTIIKI